MDASVPATWVTADEAYGGDSKFRRWLEDQRIGCVVAVSSSQTIPAVAGPSRADMLVAHAPDQAWNAAAVVREPKDHGGSTGPSRSYRPTPTPPRPDGNGGRRLAVH